MKKRQEIYLEMLKIQTILDKQMENDRLWMTKQQPIKNSARIEILKWVLDLDKEKENENERSD